MNTGKITDARRKNGNKDLHFKKALRYSFLLLKYRARSRNEITLRLKKKGYNSFLTGQIVNYLQKNNYINDKEFTRLFIISALEKGWGPGKVECNLKKLGISSGLRKQVFSRGVNYRNKIREIITKRIAYYKGKGNIASKKKAGQRLVRFLAARGFAEDDIREEIESFGIEGS